MTAVEIREARRYHCGRLVRALRREHRWSIERLGFDPHRSLCATFEQSCIRRVALVDGELAAMWGMVSTLLSPFGIVWAGFTPVALRHRLLLVRYAREQLEDMSADKLELITTIASDDEAAQRFAAFLGFHEAFQSSMPGPGQRAWSKAGRAVLLDHIGRSPDCRVPIGSGYEIRMGWHVQGSER